jgi:hypothetical protein
VRCRRAIPARAANRVNLSVEVDDGILPGEPVRIVGIAFEAPLSRIALPLRGEMIPVELHNAYRHAYRQTTTAWHIHHEGRYTEDDLPFPSHLTDAQRRDALASVARWQQELAQLRGY